MRLSMAGSSLSDGGARATAEATRTPDASALDSGTRDPGPTITQVEGTCPLRAEIEDGGHLAKVTFDDFSVALTERSGLASATCTVQLSVKAGKGEAYALESWSANGTVSLAEGVSAQVVASSKFSGQAGAPEQAELFRGPTARPFTVSMPPASTGLQFSPCETQRTFLLSLRLQLGRASGISEFRPGKISLSDLGPMGFTVRPCTP